MIEIGTPKELGIESNKVVEFYKKEWKRPIALGDKEFYKWQFINVPLQDDLDSCCIAVDDSIIVGVMGVNSRCFYLNDKEFIGGELTTWIVKEEYRNKGIGPKMISYLTDKYEVLTGMGISSDALTVYLRTGFKYLKSIPRFIKILDWNKLANNAIYEPLAKKVSKLYDDRFKQYKVTKYNDDILDFIFNNFKKRNNLFSRKNDFIKWRYLNHPMFQYDLYIIEDNEIVELYTFISLRIEKASNGLDILHVVDFYGDKNSYDAAISFICDYARDRNISVIDFFCTNSSVNSFFIKNGWLSSLDHDFFKLPHLFQPIELREPTTTSLIYWSKYDIPELYDTGILYITKEDADFDRPVLGVINK